MTDTALSKHGKQAEADMHQWILVARRLVHEDFTGNEVELQRLVIQAASTLMIQDKLGQLQTKLEDIEAAIYQREDT